MRQFDFSTITPSKLKQIFLFLLTEMTDEANMSFKQKDSITRMFEHLELTRMIHGGNTPPEVESSILNGTHIKEIIMIHSTLRTQESIGNTELILMSRTFANTATCNESEKERGSALKRIVVVIMEEGPSSVAKALLTSPLDVLSAPPHRLRSPREYQVTQTGEFVVDHLTEVAAAVRFPPPDLKNWKRHALKDIIKLIN